MEDDRYTVTDALIYYKNRVFLVSGSKAKEKILRVFHDTPLAGHQGYFKTYRQIRERFVWNGTKEDVLKHIKECMAC